MSDKIIDLFLKQCDAILLDFQDRQLRRASNDDEEEKLRVVLIAKQLQIGQLFGGGGVETMSQTGTSGDQFEVHGDAGVVAGHGSHVHDVVFAKQWQELAPSIDLQNLAIELASLRLLMRSDAVTPEQDASVGAVANAELAAKADDGPGVLAWLAKAGKWVLEMAEKVGTPIAIAASKAALGL